MSDRSQRIGALTRAIEAQPNDPAPYLYRGELLAEQGEAERALQDFRRAALLADGQFKTQSWGVVAQVIRDRALRGLQQAQGALGRSAKRGGEA
jgi:tetratricopeptide (TPR) repeat protein